MVTFAGGRRPEFALRRPLEFSPSVPSEGDFMSGEISYLSRFFVKFVEISAAGLASAICAYLLAHFGGLLSSSPTPASAPASTTVQVGPTSSAVAESRHAQPTPPAADAAVNKQSPMPQQDTDAPVVQPARKAVKDSKALPTRKRTKTDTSATEKEPRDQKSAEALARAALANVDANRPAPNDALIEPGLTDTRHAPVDVQPRRANVPPRQADVGPPPPVPLPPRAGGIEATPHAADVQLQPLETSPATGADLQPGSRDVRPSPVTPVDIQSRPVAAVDPLSPRADPPLEISAPQQPPTADQDKGVFSALKRIPDLLRPEPPAPTGETPRPPMPVGTASPEIK
jgi:hypothetical protein